MNEKLRPALFGGLLAGVLSALPIIGAANICCCLWAVVGGLLAGYLYINNSPQPIRTGDGALVGLFAGAIGGLIYVVLGIPLSIIFSQGLNQALIGFMSQVDPAQADLLRTQLENQSFGQVLMLTTLGALVGAIFLAAFCTVGGLIAVPLFGKRRPTDQVPPLGPAV